MGRLRWVWSGALALCVVGLAVSAWWIRARYFPVAAQPVDFDSPPGRVGVLSLSNTAGRMLLVQRAAAFGVAVSGIGLMILTVRRSRIGPVRAAAGVTSAVTAAISVAVAGLTARLLMWDQLALWAVTTGAGLGRGVTPAMSDQVRVVLVDGREISPDEFHVVVSVHAVMVLLTVAAAIALIVLALWPTPNSRTTTTGAGVGTPDPDTGT